MQQPGVESAAESDHESQLVLERSDLAANLTANLTTLIGGGVSPRHGAGEMKGEVRRLRLPPPLPHLHTLPPASPPSESPSPSPASILRALTTQVCRSRPLSATSAATLSARKEDGELQARP
jgi:hypothetical protein